MKNIYLSIVIPAYNEGKKISATLSSMNEYLRKQDFSYEILVVDDGSTDNTADVVKKLEKKIVGLRLVANKKNHGKGYVVRQGMLEANGQYRLFTDADNSTTLDHLDKFWPEIKNNYDIVIGSIEVAGSKIHEEAAWYRRFLGRVSKYIIRAIAGLWKIKDSQRGFKLFTDKAAKSIFPKQTIERWGFDIEVLVIAKKKKFKVKELPVNWSNPGESKVTLGDYVRTFQELLKIKYNLITGKYK